MMDKAREHYEAREWEQAETLLREAVADNPADAEAMFMLAQVLREQGRDLDEAVELMEQVERLEPFNPNVFHARGALELARRDTAAAERSFHQALEIDPGHVSSRNGLAFLELAAGRFEAAEHSADLALAEAPDNAQALTYKGTALLELGQSREATAYLQEALRLDPSALTAQMQLGRAFLAGGNAAFAMRCFENALQAVPGSAELLEYLGRAQLGAGHVTDALGTLREAVGRGRATPELYRDLAACETATGGLGRAEGLLMTALEAVPGRADLVLPWAELLLARGAAVDAMTALDTLDREAADSGPAVELRTRALMAEGRAVAALDCIREHALSEGASVGARLLLVEALQANGREAEAASVLEELFALDPVPASVRLFEARARFRDGDPAAIDALRDLLRDGGLDQRLAFQARHMLAEALHRAGRFAEAAKAYDAVAHRRAEILLIDHELQSEHLEAPESALEESVVATWPTAPPPDGRAQPVFVIGWPGSAQERVLPALGAHPEIALVLDQGPSQAERRAQVDRPRGATALGALDDAQVQLRRGRYWKMLDKAGFTPGDGLTLDAMWLTAESLPTIARLFPGAKVVVFDREPRDLAVYWMRAGYRDLDAMARTYRRQLDLLERCRDLLPLEFVQLDYDALLEDPGDALRGAVRALGIDWDPAVLERFEKVPMPVDVRPGEWRGYAAKKSAAEGGGEESGTLH